MLGAGLVLFAAAAATGDRPGLVHVVEPGDFALPEREEAGHLTASVRRADDAATGAPRDLLWVEGIRAEGPWQIQLGWIPVEPNRRYRARYRVRTAAPETEANFYLMIRPHTAPQTRPIPPYPRTSVRHRALAGGAEGEWTERSIEFETADDITTLSGSIVIAALHGALELSEWSLVDVAQEAAQQVETARTEQAEALAELHAAAARRERRTPRPLVFSRGQVKYGLDRSYYYHEYAWLDRPLLVNRAYRPSLADGVGPGWLYPARPGADEPREQVVPYASLKRTLEEILLYDLDGIAFFPQSSDRMPLFGLAERIVAEHPHLAGVGVMGEFLPGRDLESYAEILERKLASPLAPRIDGKLLITSYGAASDGPEAWGERLAALRERFGDVFIFLPSLATGGGLRGSYLAGTLGRAEIEEARATLRTWLDVCDGIYFNYPPAFRNVGVMPRTFDRDFYENVFIPLFRSVLAEPAYREKYLGLSAYRSHMMPERGNTLHEDGTRTIRNSLEPVLAAEPDVVLLPEWDEQNENTSWRPTVYSGTATRRVVRHYMGAIRGRTAAPMPGDDTALPNLIVSARKIVTLGEEAVFELLNIPDTPDADPYRVEVHIRDAEGRLLHVHGPIAFDGNRLQEERLALATEQWPDATALVPELHVEGYRGTNVRIGDGLPHVRVRATWNWNHLYVRQPLRDRVRAETARLAWAGGPEPDGALWIEGAFAADEPLALVELVADDREVYAVDPSDEFFRADPGRRLFLIDYRAFERIPFEGTVTLENTEAEWFFQAPMLHQPETAVERQGSSVRLGGVASVHARWVYLAVPTGAVPNARLRIEAAGAHLDISLPEVLEKGLFVHTSPGGVQIAVSPFTRQIDMPFHLGRADAEFRIRVWPEIETEHYHLRVTAQSGRTWRSAPLALPGATGGGRERLRVYSSRERRGVDVEVDSRRIPDLAYAFDDSRGDMLWTGAGRPFWAGAGGYVAPVVGRGAASAIHRRSYASRTAPARVESGGTHALRFDGRSMFAKLPLEALPRRSAFTIDFEVRPESAKDQVLLMNRIGSRQKGLGLEIRGGHLAGSFRTEDWNTERFSTDLALPAGEWSPVRVDYDFERIRFTVNGETESFPLNQPACNNGYTLIGDGWRNDALWFEGELRRLQIRHNADTP